MPAGGAGWHLFIKARPVIAAILPGVLFQAEALGISILSNMHRTKPASGIGDKATRPMTSGANLMCCSSCQKSRYQTPETMVNLLIYGKNRNTQLPR